MADNNAYTVQQILRDTLEVSGQASLGDMYAKVKEMERQSLGLPPRWRASHVGGAGLDRISAIP